MTTNRRYHFKLVNLDDNKDPHFRKYGSDPGDALFRYQLELLRREIRPEVFRIDKKAKKTEIKV